MSTTSQGVFAHIQLRSSTPAPNEKVLSFLQGMQLSGEEPDNTPPRSMVDPDEYVRKPESIRGGGSNLGGARSPPPPSQQQIYSPAPRSRVSNNQLLEPPFQQPMLHDDHAGDGDDAHSNVQDGVRSELGEMPLREPGPNDPPGVKYASYDSGPSFGNLGPLPSEDHPAASQNPYAAGGWNPNWNQIVNAPMSPPQNGGGGNVTGLTEGGLSAYPAGLTSGTVPVPASNGGGTPRQTAANIGVASPSRASQRDLAASPKPASRAQSRAGTGTGMAGMQMDQRPWSPMSGRSKALSPKGTVYPPLPESRMGDYDAMMSPGMSRARSKAPSISPSDSPSQMPKQAPASPPPPSTAAERVHMFAPKSPYSNGGRSLPPGSMMSGGGGNNSRPFSPYRHAPTQEDLLNAAVRNRALVIPEVPEPESVKEPSVASKAPSKIPSPQSRAMSQMEGGKPMSQISLAKTPSNAPSQASRASRAHSQHTGSQHHHHSQQDKDLTPTPSRARSPDEMLDAEERRIIEDALATRTPRTSYYAATLEPDATKHFHDMELCVLLHQESDPNQHEVVKKALRKAVRQRIKKLGMKYDHESIKQYRKSYHDHDPSVHLQQQYANEEPPQWAADLKREIVLMQQRIESLGPKIEGLRSQDQSFTAGQSRFAYEPDESTRTPMTQTVNIQTQPTGTMMADSMYHARENETILDDDGNIRDFDDRTETETQHRVLNPQSETAMPQSAYGMSEHGRDDSPGQQYLEEELYKLKQKSHGSHSVVSHRSWEVAQHDDQDDIYENEHQSGLPTIPDTNGDAYQDKHDELDHDRANSPPLPELPDEAKSTGEMAVRAQGPWNAVDYSATGGGDDDDQHAHLPPWQRIHAKLLSWAIIWPMSEFENALNSTTRGQQVDEVALTIWSTQAYKRYVRARLTDSPQGTVDRLFVPPNMADAINNAVFNGRHGDACGMLKALWTPFGLEGTPRLIVVLAKHRNEPNHWVVHRFCLPEGSLTTYDSYPERTLPDGRPLGWWFAIRVAWPSAGYPSPDHLMQKMVRLHRPVQLPIDNSAAAAGIWRNVLMGSRAERSVDLERLRDLINTEVKNLKRRKQIGKLSVGGAQPTWDDLH